jgi:tetratricopeptide (TPR) repeat protein
VRFIAELMTIFIGAFAALVVAAVFWDAASSHALVIEAFSVPPDLAQQGLTGETAARRLQDRLAVMQEEAGSARAAASYESTSHHEVRVELPETGISLAEIEHFLRDRFGHDVHISGEIYRTPEGLTLSVRSGEAGGVTVTGPGDKFGDLIDSAAQDVFARTQPYRYATWLIDKKNDKAAARALMEKLTGGASKEDRIWAYLGLNSISKSRQQARTYVLKALALDPGLGHAWTDLSDLDGELGLDEANLQDARRCLKLVPGQRDRRVTALASDWDMVVCRTKVAFELQDHPEVIKAAESMFGRADYSGMSVIASFVRLDALVRLHQPRAAEAGYERSLSGAPDKSSAFERLYADLLKGRIAAEDQNWVEAVAQFEAATREPDGSPNESYPLLAESYARLGRFDDARKLIAALPMDCYGCVIARAKVAELSGDAAGADRWFAEAVRQGPSLPLAYSNWGDSLARRGKLDAAIEKYRAAASRGPRWADPLKGWGDALARQGRWSEARGRYDEALKRAPGWAALAVARKAAAGRD